MNSLQTNYQALVSDESEAPHESVIFHVASEGGKCRWNHVGDLDTFFRRIYTFHQKRGFKCIIVEQTLNVIFVCLVIFGFLYCGNCIYFNFDVAPSPFVNRTDIQLQELFMPLSECATGFGVGSWLVILMGVVYIVYLLYKLIGTYYSYKEIEQFYESAMKISQGDIHNITWHEVQCRLREVQHEQQMCVQKSDLTELDIYHRILRHKNYMVAMVNKNVLPLSYRVMFFGEWIFFSSALQKNIELLLFTSLLSPFRGAGTLKEEFKKYSKRKEMSDELSKNILIFGMINLIFAPLILVFQLLTYFLTYSGVLRYEPAFLSTRKWSAYARLYLRHFNELDHEQDARLGRAYKSAQEYMRSFSSCLSVIVLKFIRQILGCVVVFLLIWSIFKEKLFMNDYTLIIISSGTLVFYALSACIPDENTVYFPTLLMQRVIADIHYVPDHFKTLAHTTNVKNDFSQLFPYTLVHLVEELVSPIVTPYILIFHLRHRALDIVDFLRSFTVDVAGVGDVCSFSLMDVSRHGNQNWTGQGHTKADQYQQAEGGKTELSLIHFTLMNPTWEPPPASSMFINDFREQVQTVRDRCPGIIENTYYNSFSSISTLGSRYANLVNSIAHMPNTNTNCNSMMTSGMRKERHGMIGGLHQAEGPPHFYQNGVLPSSNDGGLHSMQVDINPMEVRAADMGLSALFLHEVHDRHLETSQSLSNPPTQTPPQEESNGHEESPLLDVRRDGYIP